MKQLLLITLAVSFFACTKDHCTKTQQEITGTWELERFVGYPAGALLPPGNGKIIILRNDGSFRRMQHDTLVYTGTYTLQRKKDCYSRDSDVLLTVNDSTTADSRYVKTENGKLVLSTPNCYQDGGTAYYRRLE